MGNSHATMLTASWKRQLLNNVLHPETAITSTANRDDFGHIPVLHRANPHLCPRRLFLHARKQKLGTFIIRGQAGYTVARDNADVPRG
ncbi:outer membrane protein, OMP85 family [Neisseria gonorrhoeae]|uniref:Outer membrane protein, OMP85 family n=1 Tax=Neisseria gonorrhoeae TaxID=485 RepID=A0A378W3I1_NEIGO|nr:outer membrane protein, OMP85 family [Neisseria gonorrhoeae]